MLYFFEEATPKAGINLTDSIKEFHVDGNKIVFTYMEENRVESNYGSSSIGALQKASPTILNVGQKPVAITFPDAETANEAFDALSYFLLHNK